MCTATQQILNRSLNDNETITRVQYLQLELQEIIDHCWIAVEKRVDALKLMGKTVDSVARTKHLTPTELLLRFKRDAEKDWANKYARRFHAYYAPHVMGISH